MECSQVYKVFANESHNDKLRLTISKKPRKMQLEFGEILTIDNTNNNKTSVKLDNNSDKLNSLYISGGCKTTAL